MSITNFNSKRRNDVYPKYTVFNNDYRTYIRKEHKGTWYVFLLKCRTNDLAYFLYQAYLSILFGKIDLELKDINGNDIYSVDENQESEEQRLLPIFNNP